MCVCVCVCVCVYVCAYVFFVCVVCVCVCDFMFEWMHMCMCIEKEPYTDCVGESLTLCIRAIVHLNYECLASIYSFEGLW